MNRRAPDGPGYRDRSYVFQVELELRCEAGFFGRPYHSDEGASDPDDQIGDLHYRDCLEYAVGHGVSVHVPDGQDPVARIRTTWLPRYEVRRVIARSEPAVTVSMERLAELGSAGDVRTHLGLLPDKYAAWIAEQRRIDVGSRARSDAQKALLDRAEQVCRRIRDGIELLCTEADVLKAFCTGEPGHGDGRAQEARRRGAELASLPARFRAAQLAGTVGPVHDDRQRAELIFFPTGGGKTEAYLGAIAFTLVLRRLRGRAAAHGGLGVAVMLRYTLRLLTLDQLGRAATLVCALEVLRRRNPERLGEERFSVGLWVGRSATSNTMAEAQKAVTQFQTRRAGNPAPITNCPWCNAALTASSLSLRSGGKLTSQNPEEVHVSCPNDSCEFCGAQHADGIPVLFVDEQVYRELPSFLIGTVDKFAMIPWRGEAGKLFGRVTGRMGRLFFNATDGARLAKGAIPLPQGTPPPELIVQDELHLISGPLGTMVGLYETAVDFLSQTNSGGVTVHPKVIAATATVRRAAEQIQALYGRKAHHVCVFPPPAVNAMDTYFSVVDPDETNPGRLYLGVAAPGRAMKAILLRVYRALTAGAAHAYRASPEMPSTADAYTTLAGYFNSLRELGGMRRIVDDELQVRAKEAEKFRPLDFAGEHSWFDNRKLNAEPVELTSRVKTEDIKKAKDRLSRAYGEPEHVDVVLASNMISVGIDIDRLGLMVVAGQPKTTAEYIQASSRVGAASRPPGARGHLHEHSQAERPLALRALLALPPVLLSTRRGNQRNAVFGSCSRSRPRRDPGRDGALFPSGARPR